MPVPKGVRIGGRQKGTPNKLTSDVKAAIIEALENAGGVDYLTKLATSNSTAFCTLVGKVIPTTLAGDPKNPVHVAGTLEVKLVRPAD